MNADTLRELRGSVYLTTSALRMQILHNYFRAEIEERQGIGTISSLPQNINDSTSWVNDCKKKRESEQSKNIQQRNLSYFVIYYCIPQPKTKDK